MAPGMDVARSHGGTAKNGGGTWPWGHNEDMAMAPGMEVARGHQEWQGMEVALSMDVARGHMGTARNGGGNGQSDGDGTGHGGGSWPSGHSNNMEVASGMDVTRGHQAWQGDGDGTGHGCGTWPWGHSKEWRWHRAGRWHMATKHGNCMAVAQGRDVTCGHQAWQGGGDGTGRGCDTWLCGHSNNMEVAPGNQMTMAQGREVTRGHVGTARTW